MQEVPLFPLWVTVFLTIWAAAGPVVGILTGHYLTRSWQRRQWIADNRKDEYRKLLAGLNRLNMVLVQDHTNQNVGIQEIKEAMEEISIALNTSLFIVDFLEESKVADDVLQASRQFKQGGSFDDYRQKYWKAVNSIIGSAKKSMP
ncbi:MAG: hypothetical protein WBV69_24730 [Candidatus Sulfotelmatobacter sp.]